MVRCRVEGVLVSDRSVLQWRRKQVDAKEGFWVVGVDATEKVARPGGCFMRSGFQTELGWMIMGMKPESKERRS